MQWPNNTGSVSKIRYFPLILNCMNAANVMFMSVCVKWISYCSYRKHSLIQPWGPIQISKAEPIKSAQNGVRIMAAGTS